MLLPRYFPKCMSIPKGLCRRKLSKKYIRSFGIAFSEITRRSSHFQFLGKMPWISGSPVTGIMSVCQNVRPKKKVPKVCRLESPRLLIGFRLVLRDCILHLLSFSFHGEELRSKFASIWHKLTIYFTKAKEPTLVPLHSLGFHDDSWNASYIWNHFKVKASPMAKMNYCNRKHLHFRLNVTLVLYINLKLFRTR